MNKFFIESTKATPRVEFQLNGELFISGRSLPEDPFEFYNPLFDWVNQCTLEKIALEIRLEYMNTSSSKQIYNLLIRLKENNYIKDLLVIWCYEIGDEDGFETGKEFESMLKIPFNFNEYAEVVTV